MSRSSSDRLEESSSIPSSGLTRFNIAEGTEFFDVVMLLSDGVPESSESNMSEFFSRFETLAEVMSLSDC